MQGFQHGKGTGHATLTRTYTMPGWLLQQEHLVSSACPPEMTWEENPRRHALPWVCEDSDVRNCLTHHHMSMCKRSPEVMWKEKPSRPCVRRRLEPTL